MIVVGSGTPTGVSSGTFSTGGGAVYDASAGGTLGFEGSAAVDIPSGCEMTVSCLCERVVHAAAIAPATSSAPHSARSVGAFVMASTKAANVVPPISSRSGVGSRALGPRRDAPRRARHLVRTSQ